MSMWNDDRDLDFNPETGSSEGNVEKKGELRRLQYIRGHPQSNERLERRRLHPAISLFFDLYV